jgi:sugar phosphate isomerase/epimerase
MKLGFLTDYSDERIRFAHATGFDCLELRAQPHSALDKADWMQVKNTLDECGVTVSALACYINHLEEGKEEEQEKYFSQILQNASLFNCNVVATLTGCTAASQQSGKIEDSLNAFENIFSRHARTAEDNGVRIAFENWPGGHPWPLMKNIAITPFAWEKIFDAVPSPALGLEYDPSHLARLHIDYIAPIHRFADRIHHVHAKDTTIKTDVLNEVGYIGQGWWHYSIPSLGVIEWDKFFAALQKIGYDGGVVIEHEDPNYMREQFGKGEQFDEGLRIGQQFLSQYTN